MGFSGFESEKIEFTNTKGEKLAGRLERPSGAEPVAYALFAHCFTCTKDIASASRIAMALAKKGIGVLRFDFTGLGNSDGDFGNTNFSSNVADLVCAAKYMREHLQPPKIIIGHSLGGAAVLAAAHEVEEAKAVVTIAAPSDPGHVSHLFEGDIDKIEAEGAAVVNLAGRKFEIKKQFLDDISVSNVLDRLSGLRKALLVFHSPVDNLVSVDHAAKIFMAAKHPKSFVSLDHADHLLMKREDAEYVGETIASWATRYIGSSEDTSSNPDRSLAQENALSVEEVDQKFLQRVDDGRHVLAADEPPSVGGTDKGPTPYEYLAAGLGACTTMTVRMYAGRKGIPLKKAKVVLKHSKIHAKDCADCETETGKIDEIQRELYLEGDLTEEQRQKLLEIADKCPVHRTLHSEVKVRTTLK